MSDLHYRSTDAEIEAELERLTALAQEHDGELETARKLVALIGYAWARRGVTTDEMIKLTAGTLLDRGWRPPAPDPVPPDPQDPYAYAFDADDVREAEKSYTEAAARMEVPGWWAPTPWGKLPVSVAAEWIARERAKRLAGDR
jgi:hypothetical protein